MFGKMTLLEKVYPIVKAELHLPKEGETRLMYLYVEVDPDGGFAIWQFDLTRLDGVDGLDGKRLHTHWPGEAFEDDTLGTDTIGVADVTDLNYLQADGEGYGYREIQVDFARVQGRQYRVEVRFTLMTNDGDPADDLPATAEFIVEADEQDPFADSR